MDDSYPAIKNFPMVLYDVVVAEDIFEDKLGFLKWEITRSAIKYISTEIILIPPSILTRYTTVVLSGVIMKFRIIPFLTTVSRNFMLRLSEYFFNTQSVTTIKGI